MNITRENTEVISVHVTPNKIFIRYATYEKDVLTNHKVEYLSKQKPVHADFRKSLEQMNVHLHGVFGFDESLFENVSTSGIEIQQKDNQDSVKVFGKFCLKSKNVTPIRTDYIRLESEEPVYKYEEHDDISDDTNLVREEAFKYLFENKQAQMVIDFPKDDNTKDSKEDLEEKEVINETQTDKF